MGRRVRHSTAITGVLVLVTILALAAAVTAGCGSEVDSAEGLLELGEADNGEAFAVAVGDTIKVMLPGNPTTGFEWTSAVSDEDAALIEQQGEAEYVAESTDPTVVGSGGMYTFTFIAADKGEALLKLEYARSFEDVPPEQTFEVTLTIE